MSAQPWNPGLSPEELTFRPATYWPEDSLRVALFGNVKGQVRRRMILDALATGDCPPAALLAPGLPEPLRQAVGRIHPMFMGGEYLPDYEPREVEIARIELRSTTRDVISVRAGLEEDGTFCYRVVDEYGTWFALPIRTSEQPLTLGELLQVFEESSCPDRTGLVMPILDMNAESVDPDALRGFITVSSEFYPQLCGIYHDRCDAYLDSLLPEPEGEEDDDEA